MSTGAPVVPAVGAYVVDTRDGRVGQVVGREGPRLRLRPVGGGREWECAPGAVRCATAGERLRAETGYANARSRGERAW
ncbi:hypothetical protein [Streptomyces noursei]|uniref:Uncharacterized protein n=1 Tax=Streptomyces yunnanensis TaxID=156453 RepID=A0A9X8MIK4_9ACTN|nr:hypothetical protein SAMN05216268_101173 [Streptomyces yunnanensis]